MEGRSEMEKIEELSPPRAKYLSHREVFVDRFALVLREPLRSEYIARINRETRRDLNEGLDGVLRWQGIEPKKLDPDFKETDLDHEVECVSWCNEVEDGYPSLKKAVSKGREEEWNNLPLIMMVHDVGEIFTDDLSVSSLLRKTAAGQKQKRKEGKIAYRLLKHVKPEDVSSRLIELYKRYDRREPSDILVNFGHFIDKAQADANAAIHLVPFNRDKYNAESLISTECHGISYAEKAAAQIDDPKARKELAALIEDKVIRKYDAVLLPADGHIQELVRNRVRKNIIK